MEELYLYRLIEKQYELIRKLKTENKTLRASLAACTCEQNQFTNQNPKDEAERQVTINFPSEWIF